MNYSCKVNTSGRAWRTNAKPSIKNHFVLIYIFLVKLKVIEKRKSLNYLKKKKKKLSPVRFLLSEEKRNKSTF